MFKTTLGKSQNYSYAERVEMTTWDQNDSSIFTVCSVVIAVIYNLLKNSNRHVDNSAHGCSMNTNFSYFNNHEQPCYFIAQQYCWGWTVSVSPTMLLTHDNNVVSHDKYMCVYVLP